MCKENRELYAFWSQRLLLGPWKSMLACWLLCQASTLLAQTPLPSDFGSDRHRLVSAKSWTVAGLHYLRNQGYQWLPDGRIFVWIGNDSRWQALLVNTQTGKQTAIPLFSDLYVKANPPTMAALSSYVAPDGKSVFSFLNRFMGPIEFFRMLSFDGYEMHIYPASKQFYWTKHLTWEWNASYHGWVQFAQFNKERTGLTYGIAHIDLSHAETPRIVELTPASLPEWFHRSGSGVLKGVTVSGEGILAPQDERYVQEWTRQHKIPVSLIDIDKGIRPPTNYLVAIPSDASIERYVLSPDTQHIVWQLEFDKPHSVPGLATLAKTSELWFSDLDGANMHRLAYQVVRSRNITEEPRDVAWMNNQTISFFLNDVLYSMPAR